MASAIDPSKPADGVAASKPTLRANLQAAKDEIEDLQGRQIPTGGALNQVLQKTSSANFAMGWASVSSASTAVPQGFATPEQYGCAGDGTTNDSSGWISMCNALEAGDIHGIWCLPSKVYAINRSAFEIVGRNDFTILGNGARVKANDAHDGGDFRDWMLIVKNCSRWSIRDLIIDGARDTFAPQSEYGHNFVIEETCFDFHVENVHSLNAVGDGLLLGPAPVDAIPVSNHPRGFTFANCRFENAYRNGATLDYCHDGLFINCRFENANGTNPRAGCDAEPITDQGQTNEIGASNITFVSCLFKDNEGAGLQLSGTKDLWFVQSIAVVGCIFDNNSTIGWGDASTGGNAREGRGGIYVAGAEDVTISGCIFRNHTTAPDNDSTKHVIWLKSNTPGWVRGRRFNITGNHFYNNPGCTSLIASRREIGAYGDIAMPIAVIGNTFDASTGLYDATGGSGVEEAQPSIVSYAYNDAVIKANFFIGDASTVIGVKLPGGANNVEVTENSMRALAKGFEIGSGATAIVRANTMVDVTTPYDNSGTISSGYPTSNPGVAGVIWNDGGTLKVVP